MHIEAQAALSQQHRATVQNVLTIPPHLQNHAGPPDADLEQRRPRLQHLRPSPPSSSFSASTADGPRRRTQGYDPSLSAAIVFLVAFGLITLFQTVKVVRSRIWWLVVLLIGGLGASLKVSSPSREMRLTQDSAGEVLGWAGRAWASKQTYSLDAFLMQQIWYVVLLVVLSYSCRASRLTRASPARSLILAPCFFSATCYGILGMIVRSLGPQYSYLRPALYLWIFCLVDLVAIVVQAIGGAMAALALEDDKSSDSGTHIMVAGIAFQLACMVAFAILALDVYRRVRRDRSYRAVPHAQEGRLSRLGWALAWATTWIIIRGIYRTIELSQGWTGYLISASSPPRPLAPPRRALADPCPFALLAAHEPYFAVLDSAAMVLCQAAFCVAWPAKEQHNAVERRVSHDSDETAAAAPAAGKAEKVQQTV